MRFCDSRAGPAPERLDNLSGGREWLPKVGGHFVRDRGLAHRVK